MPASGPSLNGIAAIKAFTSSQLADRTILWDSSVHNAARLYVYNSASTAAADDNLILMPADNPAAGRWERNVAAASGGGVTVDSVIATSIPDQPFGTANIPALSLTATPTAIGQTVLVYRRYSGIYNNLIFGVSSGLVITRSALYTAIGLTANDWVTDGNGIIDIEYLTTNNGDPIAYFPGLSATNDLKIEPNFDRQRLISRAMTTAGTFHRTESARVETYDTGLPVAGSTTYWWDWASGNGS